LSHIRSFLTDEDSTLKYKVRNRTHISFKIRGTTFSGHPTSTTLFNSIRVILYCAYAASLSGLDLLKHDEIKLFVSGDDVLIRIKEELASKMEKGLSLVYDYSKQK